MIVLESWVPYSYSFSSANTDASLSPAIDANSRFEVIDLIVTADGATSADTAVRIGFGASTLPASSSTPASPAVGILLDHPGLPAGAVAPGIPGKGARGEELRITSEAATGGALTVTFLARITS